MHKETFNWTDESFFEKLLIQPELDAKVKEKCELLVTDHLFCLYGGFKNSDKEITKFDSAILDAAEISKLSSLLDLDDVNWPRLGHPGSIVISSVLGVALNEEVDYSHLTSAIACGYGVFHYFAGVFDDSNRLQWHPTALAGIFGATMATAKLLNLSEAEIIRAIKFAGTAVGGSSNVAFARNGGTRFTRAQATLLGMYSAYEARSGSPGADNLFFGPGGLSERFIIRTQLPEVSINDGLEATTLRYFPWSGFSHQALINLSAKLPMVVNKIRDVEIFLPASLFGLIGTENYGPWWSIRAAIASTIRSGSPMIINGEQDEINDFTVNVKAWENPFGQIQIRQLDSTETIHFGLPAETKPSEFDTIFLQQKWQGLADDNKQQIKDLASGLFSNPDQQNFRNSFVELFYDL